MENGKKKRFSDDELVEFHNKFKDHVVNCEKQFIKLNNSISTLSMKIEPVLEDRRDWKGAIRIGKKVQSFIKWAVGMPLIGAGIHSIVKGLGWID